MTQKQLYASECQRLYNKLNISNVITDCDFATPSTEVRNLNVILTLNYCLMPISKWFKNCILPPENIARLHLSLSLPDAERPLVNKVHDK